MTPDKIYIHEASAPEMTDKLPYHIEYIRKDAFIEKACEWLRTHSEDDYFELIPFNYCGAGNLNKKKMIEDFKKYMKGE